MAEFTWKDAWDYVVTLGNEIPVEQEDVFNNVMFALHNFQDDQYQVEPTQDQLDAAEELHQKLGLSGEELSDFISGPLIPSFLMNHGVEDDVAIGSARTFFKFGVQVGAAYLRENQGTLTTMLDNLIEEPPQNG